MARVTYTLEDFIHDMNELVDSEPDQAALFDRGSSHLQRLLANPDAVAAQYRVPMDNRPPDKQSTTYLLHQAPSGLSITSVVWGPGSHVGPHDHCTWGMIGVLENTLTETRFRPHRRPHPGRLRPAGAGPRESEQARRDHSAGPGR